MIVEAYIHSLKDMEHDRNVLGEAEIIKSIGDNLYLAKANGVHCTAIFNPFVGRYFVDDVYGIVDVGKQAVMEIPASFNIRNREGEENGEKTSEAR